MNNDFDNEILWQMKPVVEYAKPKYPTLDDTRGDSSLLKKVPLRWRKNARIVACLGLAGMIVCSSCVLSENGAPPAYTQTENTINNTDEVEAYRDSGIMEQTMCALSGLMVTLHNGGAGGSGYIVHLTEQEARGIIFANLQAAGLKFSAEPPEYIVGDRSVWDEAALQIVGPPIGLDWFDEEKSVAVAHVSWEDSNRRFSRRGGEFAEAVAEDFKRQADDIHIGVFYTPGIGVRYHLEHEDDWIWGGSPKKPNLNQVEQAKQALIENLNAQVREFIEYLIREDVDL